MNEEILFTCLWIAAAILGTLVLGAVAKKFKQPKVLGGLVMGLVIGVVLNGTEFMTEMRGEHGNAVISFMAEFAAMLLLFKAGLEGNLNSIIQDAKTGWKVAIIGVVVPVIGGFLYVYYSSDTPWAVALFQGGVFAATSVGITAAVLTELGVISTKFGRTIISAAVIDDVLGLLVLTVCGVLSQPGEVNAVEIGIKIGGAILFVVLVPIAGHYLLKHILPIINKVDTEAREALVLGFLIVYGVGAMAVGLAAIVGAYFAGVAMEEIYFTKKNDHESDKAVEHFIDSLVIALAPIFFVYAGCIVDPTVFLDGGVLINGLIFTAIAMGGKLACGLVVKEDKWIVGIGMAPRGEVGIIFATIGLSTKVLTPALFGASMIMVLLTTFMTPVLLTWLIKPKPIQSEKAH